MKYGHREDQWQGQEPSSDNKEPVSMSVSKETIVEHLKTKGVIIWYIVLQRVGTEIMKSLNGKVKLFIVDYSDFKS